MDHKCDSEHASCIEIVPIFSSLSHEETLEIAAISRVRTFEKGEMIYRAGDKGEKLYVIHTGRVRISRLGVNGKEQVIRVIGPGEFMGELSLFSSLPMTDNGEALENSAMCIIEGAKLKELIAKYPSIAFKVMDELSKRLEKAENLIGNINLYTVEQRLAQALISMSEGKQAVILNMTRGDLASHLGMSRETLSRKLALFEEQGLIEQKGRKKILIRDRDGLQAQL